MYCENLTELLYKTLRDRDDGTTIKTFLTFMSQWVNVSDWLACISHQGMFLPRGFYFLLTVNINEYLYILLDVLLCSIAEYFYELCRKTNE